METKGLLPTVTLFTKLLFPTQHSMDVIKSI